MQWPSNILNSLLGLTHTFPVSLILVAIIWDRQNGDSITSVDEHLNTEQEDNSLAHRVQHSAPDSIFINTVCVVGITNPILKARRPRLWGVKSLVYDSRVIEWGLECQLQSSLLFSATVSELCKGAMQIRLWLPKMSENGFYVFCLLGLSSLLLKIIPLTLTNY